MAAADPYNIPVDAAVIRSVLVRRNLKKYPHLLKKPPTNVYKKDERKKETDKSLILRKRPIRTSHSKLREVPQDLEKLLWKPDFIEYSPFVSIEKRKEAKKLREKTKGKNPFCTPVEGLTHNFRNVLAPMKDILRQQENQLPVEDKIPPYMKKRFGSNAIAKQVYEETKPNAKLDSGVRTRTAFILDNVTPQEYLYTWKDIEKKIICKAFKQQETVSIEEALKNEERELIIKKESLMRTVDTLEKAILLEEQALIDLQHVVAAEKDLTKQKVTRYDALMENYCVIRHNVHALMSRFDELYRYHFFLHSVSPTEWQTERHKVYTVDDLIMDTGTYTCRFRHKTVLLDNISELSDLVSTSIEKPELYFSSVEQLLDCFYVLEDFNFTILSHSRLITESAESAVSKYLELSIAFVKEWNMLNEMKKELEDDVSWEESKVDQLKNFCYSFVYGSFSKQIADIEEWKSMLQDCYNIALNTQNDIDLPPIELMKAIEYKIVQLIEDADPSSPETVEITKKLNLEWRMREQAQKQLARKYREYDILLKNLKRAYEGPSQTGTRKIKDRSKPLNEKADFIKPPPAPTLEELEHKYFFEHC